MVTVVAKGYFEASKIEEVLKIYQELVEKTRQEAGCISYELFQDSNDTSILTMIETWESLEALQNHFKADHFVALVPLTKNYATKETEINIYTKLI